MNNNKNISSITQEQIGEVPSSPHQPTSLRGTKQSLCYTERLYPCGVCFMHDNAELSKPMPLNFKVSATNLKVSLRGTKQSLCYTEPLYPCGGCFMHDNADLNKPMPLNLKVSATNLKASLRGTKQSRTIQSGPASLRLLRTSQRQSLTNYSHLVSAFFSLISKASRNNSLVPAFAKKAILAFFFILFANQLQAADIWVSPTGSDQNNGTKEQPLATPLAAIRRARELRRLNDPGIKDGIHIILKGGSYQLFETIVVCPEDSGTASSPTILEAAPGEKPIFNGGINITGWQKTTKLVSGLPQSAKGKIWVADAPVIGGDLLNFRQLWINGRKAIRSREVNTGTMSRILSWNHKDQTCWIPKPKTADLSHVGGMEMFIQQMWAIAILRIKSLTVQGDSAKLSFFQPESRVQSEHPWPAPMFSKTAGNSAFYLSNAIQFLDQPGEWYLDAKNRKIYYWPRTGEDMTSATAVAPSLETLLKVEGTIDNPVSYVYFKNIGFAYSTWLYPSRAGLVPHQAGMYMLDAYKLKIPGTPDKKGLENQAWVGRPAAAVSVAYANHTGFELCRFEHLASTGLDYKRGTHDDEIKACLFKDIGGTGILAGVFSDEVTEVHLPYNPKDQREVCTNEHIVNNLLTDVTNEDWGCVGIGAGYVKNTNIEHNEICEVAYSGISVGWGWTKTINAMSSNRVYANKISHYAKHLYDVAGIYTLSAQPGTMILENCVDSIYKAPYAHDPVHWFYLYTDEGSSYITVKDNWCPAEKFLKNANGPGNTWENNGPQAAGKIRNTAGLESAYRFLLIDKVDNPDHQPINQYINNEIK